VSFRSLVSSFLLVLLLATTVGTTVAAAKPKPPVAKIALGAKKAKKNKATKKKTKKKAVKRSAANSSTASRAAQPAAPAAPAAPATCANTDLAPDAGNLDLIRDAVVCLHNRIRAQNGLGTLAENSALAAAGNAHAGDMVARGYFDHDTPEGGTFDQRILAAGYVSEYDGWTVGENLIWSTGTLATPAALMQSWMNSPHHRENILKASYRELGLGIRLGTPTGSAAGVTLSAEFGARS
jgi:uncharacterized protein YkwD